MGLTHPKIAEVEQTCLACPEQYEGTLVDGQPFYFRYRHGYATLAVGYRDRGGYADPSPLGASDVGMDHGGRFQGAFETDAELNHVFAELMDRIVS